MAGFCDISNFSDYFKKNKMKVCLYTLLWIGLFGFVVCLQKMECSRQTGVCVVSSFHIERLSYQTLEMIPLSQIKNMVVSSGKIFKSNRKRRKVYTYHLGLSTQSSFISLEKLPSLFFLWDKDKTASEFNQFLNNKSQMTYTYHEGKGYVYLYFIILGIFLYIFKKFYMEYNIVHHRYRIAKNLQKINNYNKKNEG